MKLHSVCAVPNKPVIFFGIHKNLLFVYYFATKLFELFYFLSCQLQGLLYIVTCYGLTCSCYDVAQYWKAIQNDLYVYTCTCNAAHSAKMFFSAFLQAITFCACSWISD